MNLFLIGSGFVKAGFAGDELPCVELPNVIGRPKRKGTSSTCVPCKETVKAFAMILFYGQ